MDVKRVGVTQVNETKTSENKGVQSSKLDKLRGASVDSTETLTRTHGSEKVEWSEEAQLAREALELARNAPDVRQERVAALKQAIKNGTYQVDSQKVADSMIQATIEEGLLTRKG